jgi:hypothetical protein
MAETSKRPKAPEFTTPPGLARYPRLSDPDTRFDPDGRYKVELRWPAEKIEPFKAKIDKLIADAFAAWKKDHKKEVADEDFKLQKSIFKQVKDDEGEPTGEVSLNVAMKAVVRWKDKATGQEKSRAQRPVVVDAKGKPTKAEPWSGSTLAVRFAIDPDYWAGQKKFGASVKMIGVQIVKLVQGGERTAESMGFETYDEGFDGDEFDGGDDGETSTNTSTDSSSDAEALDGNF